MILFLTSSLKKATILFILVFCFLIESEHSFAIYGNYIDTNYHPEQTCLVLMGEGNKAGLCSGTLIKENVLITANHCLDDYKVRPQDVKINCDGYTAKGIKAELFGPVNDLALLTLDRKIPIIPMPIADESVFNELKKNGTGKYFCAFFGYGIDNKNRTGNLHGILSESSKISFDHSFTKWVNWESEYRNLLNQTLQTTADKEVRRVAEIELEILNIPVVLTNEYVTARQTEIIKKQNLTVESYNQILSSVLNKVFKPKMKKRIDSLYEMFSSMPSLHIEYINSTSHNSIVPLRGYSGIDHGDSGGTFACRVRDENSSLLSLENSKWVLVGVNSYILTYYSISLSKLMKMYAEGINVQDFGTQVARYNSNGFASLLNIKNKKVLGPERFMISKSSILLDRAEEFVIQSNREKYVMPQDNTRVVKFLREN